MATTSFNTTFRLGSKHESDFEKVLDLKRVHERAKKSNYVKLSDCKAVKSAFKK